MLPQNRADLRGVPKIHRQAIYGLAVQDGKNTLTRGHGVSLSNRTPLAESASDLPELVVSQRIPTRFRAVHQRFLAVVAATP
jgi:hypothetical protein